MTHFILQWVCFTYLLIVSRIYPHSFPLYTEREIQKNKICVLHKSNRYTGFEKAKIIRTGMSYE